MIPNSLSDWIAVLFGFVISLIGFLWVAGAVLPPS